LPPQAFAPAKVNLYLHVGPPGPDGYHPLCSLMVFADVGDRISAEPAAALDLQVAGPFADGAPAGPDNLVLKAARAILEGREGRAARLALDKRLPVAAGLGGGSSDAGAALRLLRDLLAIELSDPALEGLAAGLGADGAACLWGRPVLAEGRGERLSTPPELPELHAVLVNPGVPVSTPQVYRRLDASGRFGDIAPPVTPRAFADAEAVCDWLRALRNDLEAPACAVEPAVGVVLKALADAPEALLARVSGSGGTCFALCADAGAAASLAGRIQRQAPDWWVRPCRLGGPWPDTL
jgi:4-diphosphocytidyl-2-C-methyl-D-erythritol kinase